MTQLQDKTKPSSKVSPKQRSAQWLLLLIGGGLLGAGLFSGLNLSSGFQSGFLLANAQPSATAAVKAEMIEAQYNSTLKQGEVLKLVVRPKSSLEKAADDKVENLTAWIGGMSAPLYYQADSGEWLGLMSATVTQPLKAYPVKIQNQAGETIHSGMVTVVSGGYSRQNISVSKSMSGKTAEPGELEAIEKLKTQTGAVRYWKEPLMPPTADCMNSRFGNLRYHNGKFTDNYHRGVDLRSPSGRPIKATAGGVVKIAQQFRLHGGTVGIDHGQGLSSIYIHQSKILVKPGDVVQAGQTVGLVGATGFATGPHLHWGLFANGLPVNPQQWVKHASCG